MKIALSSVCKAFEAVTVGTRADAGLLDILKVAVVEHDVTKDRAPGQHFVMLPPKALDHVVAGVGRRTDNPTDYVVRTWRGRCDAYLKRDRAEKATGVACVVYTRAAYGLDPDVTSEELAALGDATHVLVAVLAFAGPNSPAPPWTFVRNLAGANNEALAMTADEIRATAKAVTDYHGEWCVVAD